MDDKQFPAAGTKRGIFPNVQTAFSEAVQHHQSGRLTEAEQRYREILASDPHHAESLHLLGVLAYQTGDYDRSADLIRGAIGIDATVASYHSHLGLTLKDQGKPDEAIACYRQAIHLKPAFPEAYNNLGNAFLDLGRLDEAVASYRQALVLKPGDAEIYSNLGHVLKDQGKLEEAIDCCRQSLLLNPNDPEVHNNLGNALWEQGDLEAAQTSYRRALAIAPNYIDALNNLASLLIAQGQFPTALSVIKQTLRTKMDPKAKRIFADLVKRLHWTVDDPEIRAALVTALSEPWDRPGKLARASADLIKLNPALGECITRANNAWPQPLTSQLLFGPDGIAALAADRLLPALLTSALNTDIALERFLTMARRLMLEAAGGATANRDIGPSLAFYSALARQCFINEYVFSCPDDETSKAAGLRDQLVTAIEARTPVPALWVLAVAAYFPLHALPLAARLLQAQWPEAVTTVLVQQICEPEEEAQLRPTIPRLTGIEDPISKRVRTHYEENPYPRWVKVGSAEPSNDIARYLHHKFPLVSLQGTGRHKTTEVLIAGCGTGQHGIELVQKLKDASVLAVDLSLSSLCYAARKTRELGITSITYSQADIMELDSAGRSFDMIESAGVLHHLADPFAGWQKLLSLLRPGGFMMVGLYSEVARRSIAKAKKIVANMGLASTASQIRQGRQDLLDPRKNPNPESLTSWADFYSISTCRDLLFHLQEKQMTLAGIDEYLKDNNLTFLGFEIDGDVLHSYRQRFRTDPAATDLRNWQLFENDNPGTFSGMYQFWLQKPG